VCMCHVWEVRYPCLEMCYYCYRLWLLSEVV